MKITDVEAIALVWPAPDREYWTALRPIGRVSELLVRVHTDAGFYGIGEAHGAGQGFAGVYRQDTDGAIHADGAYRAVVDLLKPMFGGRDPVDHEQLWDEMFGSCHQIGWAASGFGRPQILTALAAVDIALWDIKGKGAEMPVYKLFGGHSNTAPCYVTGGYYQDGKSTADLVQECESYVDIGYEAIKLNIGHVSLAEPYERVRSVRSSIGESID